MEGNRDGLASLPLETTMTTSTMDMIQQHLGDEGITQLTQHLGVDPNTAKAAAAAALPALINAMSGQSSQPGAAPGASGIAAGGLAGLAGGILGNIFGGSHSNVSQEVSHKTGLSLAGCREGAALPGADRPGQASAAGRGGGADDTGHSADPATRHTAYPTPGRWRFRSSRRRDRGGGEDLPSVRS